MVAVATCMVQLSFGQTLSRRYDALNQFRAETALGIEHGSNGEFMVVLGSEYADDSLLYGSVVVVLRLDAFGDPLDTTLVQVPLRAAFPGLANSSFPLANGGYGVGGGTSDPDGTHRPTLYLFNALGDVVTVNEYGVPLETWIGRQGKQTPDGGYVICGETSSGGSADGFLLKIDNAGDQEWVQTYGHPAQPDYLLAVDIAPGGGYYLGGQRAPSGNEFDQWLLRVDNSGALIWDDTYGTPFNDGPNAHITTLADSGVLFASGWAQNNFGTHRLGLTKVDSTGALIWAKLYDGNAYGSSLFSVKEVTPGGDLIATGVSYRLGYEQGAMLRTTSDGDSLWMRYYHYYDSLWTEGRGRFYDVLPTNDGGFIAAGVAFGTNNPNDPPAYGQDTWVVKVDSMGCLEPGCHLITGLQSQVTNYRDALSISPNPASRMTRLSWELPGTLKGSCQLSVVSAQGQLVRTIPIAIADASYMLDVSDYAPGIYHLHLVMDGEWLTGGKLVVE